VAERLVDRLLAGAVGLRRCRRRTRSVRRVAHAEVASPHGSGARVRDGDRRRTRERAVVGVGRQERVGVGESEGQTPAAVAVDDGEVVRDRLHAGDVAGADAGVASQATAPT
jgi:hypothetical protein